MSEKRNFATPISLTLAVLCAAWAIYATQHRPAAGAGGPPGAGGGRSSQPASVTLAAVRTERVFAWLASGFGLLGLILACLGIYGTLGYAVARRWPEIGVRMALGATRRDVVSLILRQSLAPVLVGAAVGVGLALASTRVVQSQLFEVGPRDPMTLFIATLALLAAALLAAWLPSRRAASVDPVRALRAE